MMRTPTLLAAALVALVVGLTGCSGGGSSRGDASAGSEAPAAARAESAEGSAADADAARSFAENAGTKAGSSARNSSGSSAPRTPAVISTGTLTVESDDVAEARFDLGKVVDDLGGTIADEKTTAAGDGEVRMSRLVLRVPSAEFDRAMTELAALGDVTASTRKAEDVTTEVIDTEVRIRAQEQSLERVEVLLARAQSIRDVVAIEAQLTRRQAELDSLKSRLAWLEDQTSLATLTVYLERATDPAPTSEPEDTSAFLAGLAAGWGALAGLGAGLARVSGALLPFAVAGLLVGLPGWLLLRSLLAPLAGRLRSAATRGGPAS